MNKVKTLILGLSAIAVLTPQPANAAIARFFGWKYSDNEKYQKIEEWVDTSGNVLGLVGVIAPPAASVGAIIKTTVIVAKIVDP